MSNLLTADKFFVYPPESVELAEISCLDYQCGESIWSLDALEELYGMNGGSFNLIARDKEGQLVGFLLAEASNRKIEIISCTVKKDCRRQGVGRKMMRFMINHLLPKHFLVINVRESNLTAQLFLRSLGFKAIRIVPKWFIDHVDNEPQCEAAYRFKYKEII